MKNFLHAIFLLIFLSFANLESKVLIITHSYNRPEFIEIQDKTFKALLKDDYEFVVFNDAPDRGTEEQIEKTCLNLGLRHIRIPQSIHSQPYLDRLPVENWNHYCVRCANVVQYSLDILGFDHNGLVMIIDSDMFLIDEFSIEDYLKGHELSGVKQYRGTLENHIMYLWNGLLFFDMNKIPNKKTLNFNCGRVEGFPCDVGGYTYYYFQQNPEVRFLPTTKQLDLSRGMFSEDSYEVFREGRFMNADNTIYDSKELTKEEVMRRVEYSPALTRFLSKSPDNVQFFLDFTILHYRSGGNWDLKSAEYHSQKTSLLKEFIDEILEASSLSSEKAALP